MSDQPKCDSCGKDADYVIADLSEPVRLFNTGIGIGRIALFLCASCAGGAIGAALITAGAKLIELVR